ncbi:MAG TPA: hypothetical protein VJZ27_17305 [Aggregatilineales bacterium]|nr:hypothetical protein [Aggregatilineales bacterium]
MTNWNTITDYFLSMVSHPRHGTQAREMFKLCLLLREEPDLATWYIQPNYLYLRFSCYNNADYLVVSSDSPGFYAISLHDDGEHVTARDHESHIALGYILPVLFYFLNRLRDKNRQVKVST